MKARPPAFVYIEATYVADTDTAVLVEVGGEYRCWIPLRAIEEPSAILKASALTPVTVGVARRFARKRGWV